ncbi:acyltransferase family protein [Undibacterium sp. SXout20W]|uniref:acyltransferase family protein n=1 Tax=Undibacterium sp. SXout20W TaxID=3413051 RepID=UPI003BF35AF5
MGTLRTLFAIAVVFAHCYGFLLVGGRNAVQLFYMISGFLISFVLIEQRAYLRMKTFYINRFLRLYPVYFVVALMTLATLMFGFWMGKDVDFLRFTERRQSPQIYY